MTYLISCPNFLTSDWQIFRVSSKNLSVVVKRIKLLNLDNELFSLTLEGSFVTTVGMTLSQVEFQIKLGETV